MNTAVVIVFFNRIEPLRKLVARLSEVKPQRVYLISDGARENRAGEEEKVNVCREFMQELPWSCEIFTNYAEKNRGCRVRVTTGLDWVFEREERAIILEDDCVPEPEFFPWVEKMLDRYEKDDRVLSVGGTNLRPQLCDQTRDCVLTKYAMIWGWATWRRAWLKNDKNLELFEGACRDHLFKQWLGKWRAEWYWRYLLTHIKSSWGYRWIFTHFTRKAYCVLPPVNLVCNIGMTSQEATHTKNVSYEIPKAMRGWKCPNNIASRCEINAKLDAWVEDNFYSRSLVNRMRWIFVKARKVVAHG